MSEHHGVLVLVQGLAGSGKSHLISLLSHDFCIEENFAASDEAESRNIGDLAANLRAGRRCIVSERKYRSEQQRRAFLGKVVQMTSPSPPPKVITICFENDLEAANSNCRNRTNKSNDPDGAGHIAQNNFDTNTYQIPSDAMVVKVLRIPERGGAQRVVV